MDTGNSLDLSYNYTFLVLNVTITNYGYSQVNVGEFFGGAGFSVTVSNNNYPANRMHNLLPSLNASGVSYSLWNFRSLPSQATLLNTGSVNGIVIFQLGDPNVYPPQPQILNEPFTLQYSVTYG